MRLRWRRILQVFGITIIVLGVLSFFLILTDVLVTGVLSDFADIYQISWYPQFSIFTLPILIIAVIAGLIALKNSGLPPYIPAQAYVLLIIFTVLFLTIAPLFNRPVEKGGNRSCASQQRQIALATILYAHEHYDQLPPSATFWTDIKVPPIVCVCPTTLRRFHQQGGYGCNRYVAGKNISKIDIPCETLLTADSIQPGKMLSSLDEVSFRHKNHAYATYLDGHVGSIKRDSTIRFKYVENVSSGLANSSPSG